MKKVIFTLLLCLGFCQITNAQSPQKMSYQAVIRNASNNLVINTTVGMRISILQGSSTGTPVYVETQTPTSNANGLVSIEIGAGAIVSGTFSAINWANGPYFVKTETDPTGGTSYTIIGTSQLLSVPYALYAGNAVNYSAGSGIAINSGTITNTAPNQTVNLIGTGATNVSGSYPNYTVNSTPITAGSGISITGGTVTNTAPNQSVSLSGAGTTTVSGAYPNYTVASSAPVGGGISFTGVQYFLTAGVTTWTVPANVSKVWVKLQGGGGGGGGVNTINTPAYSGPGGGGAYAEGFINVIPNSVITITCGVGGSPGPNGGTTGGIGGTGGSSSFNGLMTAGGGIGGSGSNSGGGGTGGTGSGIGTFITGGNATSNYSGLSPFGVGNPNYIPSAGNNRWCYGDGGVRGLNGTTVQSAGVQGYVVLYY